MKSKMTIGKQLMLVFGILMVLVLVLSYASLSAIGKLENAYKDTAEKTFRKAVLAEAMNTAESEMLVGQRGLLLYSALKNPAMAEEARSLFHASSDRIAGYIKEFRPLIDTQEGHDLMGRIETGLNSWNGVFSEMEGLARSGHADQAAAVGAQRALPIHKDLATMAVRLTEIQSQTLAGNRSNAAELSTISRWITSVLILLCLLSGVGALTVVQRMNKTFQSLATELGEGAAQLASAAAQVSASSQTLAQGASEQAASLEETSASSEEISSMTMKNSENSSLAAQNMVEAARRIDGANRSLEMMITSMNEINASSDKISRIIKVIDEIAFQTNILALNAAVEAARAGDAGAGFAVVADEVRNLAQRCAQAARDTATLIAESIEKSTEGKNRLAQVAGDVRAITKAAAEAKTLVDEVNQASREQSQGINEVTRAIAQMQQVTQDAAATAEESASAGEQLSAQSARLRQMVENLTELVGAKV